MSKGIYVGVSSKAHKVKKGYIGVNGIAKKFLGGEFSYYGTATALSVARYNFAATTVGNYALFGGGENDSGEYSVVDAYDTSLTRSTPTALSRARDSLAATTVGNYALFAGGSSGGPNSSASAIVDVYQCN